MPDTTAEHTGQGGGGDAGGEGGGIELVVGVEDEGDVEGLVPARCFLPLIM
jgi:hypothetical protein